MRSRLALVAVCFTVGVLLTGCGSDSSSTEKKGSSSGATGTTITIKHFAFSPKPLRARVGDTITVKNDDSTTHTATADDGRFDTHDITPLSSATITVNKAGTVPFHCDIHNYMKGSIQVGT